MPFPALQAAIERKRAIDAELTKVFDAATDDKGELDLGRVADADMPSGVKSADDLRDWIITKNHESEYADVEIKKLKGVQDAGSDHVPGGHETGDGSGDGSGGTGGRKDTGPTWIRDTDGKPATVKSGQRFADHPVPAAQRARHSEREKAMLGQHGDLASMLKAMSTTSGSAIVPTVWAGGVIDRARAASAVLQAGAEVVPMDAKTVQIGRLTGDPTVAFRAEGSTIAASDPVLDNVTLDSKTMSALVIGSMEWFMDSPNANVLVEQALGAAMAAELDKQALFGGVIAGAEVGATGFNATFPVPPNPRGVLATLLATAPSSVLGSGANGTAQTPASFWREVVTTIFTPRQFNEEPTGLIWSPKLWQQYADAYDTTNQPLQAPQVVNDLPKFVTSVIPSVTQGTMVTRATDLFVADWRQCIIGQRLDFTVQTLVERYADSGQIGIVCTWRGDVQLARPRAFSVYRYLQGA